jgi:hypothetical protein
MSWQPNRLKAIQREMNQLRRQLKVLKAERLAIEEKCEHKQFDQADRCVACGATIGEGW